MVEPKAFQDALLAYHARPCDAEAEAVRIAVLHEAWGALDRLYASTEPESKFRPGISKAASAIATMERETRARGMTAVPAAPAVDVARLAVVAAHNAIELLLEWDKSRDFIVPYKVRDPIHAAMKQLRAAITAGVEVGSHPTKTDHTPLASPLGVESKEK